MQFIRFTQDSSGLSIVLPRPKEIKKPLETKSKVHHLDSGAPSGGNNTNLFLKYTFGYKDGIHSSFVDSFIELQLTNDRKFNYFAESTIDQSEEVFLIGKLSLVFLHAEIKHCHNLKMELFSNGEN